MGLQQWQKVSLILCSFGLLKELRPSEPYITEYILNFKNVTSDELVHVVFPVSTYTSSGALAVLLLLTDFLRYQPVVIFEAFAFVITWLILILGESLLAIIIVEIFYGIACSAEIAYYTYIYAQVDKQYYKKVTSFTSSALLIGKFMGGLLAQVLVTYNLMDYHELTYVTFTCSCLGLLATLFLPPVKSSIYIPFSSTEQSSKSDKLELQTNSCAKSFCTTLTSLWKHCKQAYSNPYILKWSIWWALASAGQYQVVNYIQALWEQIIYESGHSSSLYNGAVKSIHTLLSAVMSLSVGYVRLKWPKWGEIFLSLTSALQGSMLLWMSGTTNLTSAYIAYIIFRTIHPVVLTIASAEVAQGISPDSYGLIFGVNTFLALIVQTVLTLLFTDELGLALPERSQFFAYGIYFLILGFLFFTTFIHSKITTWTKKTDVLESESNNTQSQQMTTSNYSVISESTKDNA